MLAKENMITVGKIISFMLYLIQLVSQFSIITFAFTNLFKISGACEKIVNIMCYSPEVNFDGGVAIPADQVKGEIEFKEVSFEYPTKKDVMVA